MNTHHIFWVLNPPIPSLSIGDPLENGSHWASSGGEGVQKGNLFQRHLKGGKGKREECYPEIGKELPR